MAVRIWRRVWNGAVVPDRGATCWARPNAERCSSSSSPPPSTLPFGLSHQGYVLRSASIQRCGWHPRHHGHVAQLSV